MRAAVRGRARLLALLGLPAALLGLLFVYPLAHMAALSVRTVFPGAFQYTGAHYAKFVSDAYFLRVTQTSFALALTVTVLTAAVGYPVAYYFVRSRSRHKHWIFLGVISPLLVSIVVRTIGWTIVLGNEGLVNNALRMLGIVREPLALMNSFWSVTVGLVHVLLPFMILSIASVLGKIDTALEESAAILGAGPLRTFWRVTLPLSIQGVAAGSILVFCLTIGAYITPWWLGRGKVLLFSTTIYDQILAIVDWPFGSAAAMILVAATLAIILLYFALIGRVARR
ncbi:MAG: ABC transporter permease [Candidatus Rokubacteria bacterium]|nr:ABC transporter permease [Candidatus Rokubacteria bacterium]MBI3827353.1 ABC transporter permease [Candidatus Rokubacteria bacterium]